MKILHLCLANFYIDNYNYQENIISRINQKDGHEVLVIASTETYLDNNLLGTTMPGDYYTKDGIHIIRIPYSRLFPGKIGRKVRKYRNLYESIEAFNPDVIMIHDLCFASVTEVINYKRNNPKVVIYADTHTAIYNSGRNWISLKILHRRFYKAYVQKALPYIEKYFYIGISEKKFSIDHYGVPESIMEYLPLGGIIVDEKTRVENREKIRKELNVGNDELLFVHSGKINKRKKTVELLRAFANNKDANAKLVIAGSINDEVRVDILKLIEADTRVKYVGWLDAEKLIEYICAADFYVQPGTPSATLQQAICCFCPVICGPYDSYLLINSMYDNLIIVSSENELAEMINELCDGALDVHKIKENTIKCAEELLDYNLIANRICV